ncbi:MAG: HDIG domain-containing protein [bacterium]|nr:HDIG domain-containing protein [bacterium]
MQDGIPSLLEAHALLDEFTTSPNLRKHARAVAAAMRAYAEKFGEPPERWETVGLLHDFDYEKFPALSDHPFRGADILRSRGVSEELVKDIFAHAPHTGQLRDTPLRKAIFACDELSGFIVAVALVQPNKRLAEVTVESVLKKLKQKSFAAGVSREDIERGAVELGLSLPEHIRVVLTALQGAAIDLGL